MLVAVALVTAVTACGGSARDLTVTVVNSAGEDLTLTDVELTGGARLEPAPIETLVASSRSNHSLTGPPGAAARLTYVGPEGKNVTVSVGLADAGEDRRVSCVANGYDCDPKLSPTVITFLVN